MNRETLQELLGRRPFEPIAISTHDGAVRYVRHPECVALGAQRMVLIDPASDRFEIIPYASVSSVSSFSPQNA